MPGWCLGTLSSRGPLLGIFGRIGSCGAFSPIVHTIPLSVKFVNPQLRARHRAQIEHVVGPRDYAYRITHNL